MAHKHTLHSTGQLITLPPVNTTVALGTNATFTCRGDNIITWEIANVQIREPTQADVYRTQHKIYVPLPKSNFSELIITARNVTNYTISIVCVVGDGVVIKSEEVKLLAYGKFSNNYYRYSVQKGCLFIILKPVINSDVL